MARNPIILVDDDRDDLELFKEELLSLKIENEIIVFDNPHEALKVINTMRMPPFLVICDLNMPALDGIAFRKELLAIPHLNLKSTPFIFLSTAQNKDFIKKAYGLSIQGYFIKPSTLEEIRAMFKLIVGYWQIAEQPE